MPRWNVDPRFDVDEAEHPGAKPRTPHWELSEGLDAFFPDTPDEAEDDDRD